MNKDEGFSEIQLERRRIQVEKILKGLLSSLEEAGLEELSLIKGFISAYLIESYNEGFAKGNLKYHD